MDGQLLLALLPGIELVVAWAGFPPLVVPRHPLITSPFEASTPARRDLGAWACYMCHKCPRCPGPRQKAGGGELSGLVRFMVVGQDFLDHCMLGLDRGGSAG